MIRMKTQNSNQQLLHKHIARNLTEMKAIGYTKNFIEKTLFKLKKKPGWQNTAKTMLKFVRTVLYAQDSFTNMTPSPEVRKDKVYG